MKKFKGTPGDWHQSHREIPNDEDGMYATQVYDDQGETIATLSWYQMPPRKEVINGEIKTVIGTYKKENAKLIAAAPDMIDALLRINKAIDDMKLNDRFGHTQMYVRDAIEKALK